MRKLVATICLIICLASVASAQTRAGAWLRGQWEGTGYQIDTNSTWTMSLKVRGRSYLIEYPSLNCGGRWRLVSINANRARFRERITAG